MPTTVMFFSCGALAQQTSDKANAWQFGARIYGWFPDIKGQAAFSLEGSDSEFEVGH